MTEFSGSLIPWSNNKLSRHSRPLKLTKIFNYFRRLLAHYVASDKRRWLRVINWINILIMFTQLNNFYFQEFEVQCTWKIYKEPFKSGYLIQCLTTVGLVLLILLNSNRNTQLHKTSTMQIITQLIMSYRIF